MVGPWTDSTICPNGGSSVVVRCSGCGSRHSTKNIGWLNKETKVVTLARSLFDIFDEQCTCKDKSEFPLVHDCAVDDIHYVFSKLKFEPGIEIYNNKKNEFEIVIAGTKEVKQ